MTKSTKIAFTGFGNYSNNMSNRSGFYFNRSWWM